jgi:N-acylneuraminate cytidylyltransferase
MKIISIITARSGSKGIPHKNIRDLGGIPLLGWVVKAASKSKLSNKIILSTDSEEYFKIASSFNNEIIFHKRTPELAEDVPTELVLLDIIDKFNEFFDDDTIIVVVQPTTPFVSHIDIDMCIEKLIKNPHMNSCITVKEVTEHPEWVINKKENFDDIGECVDLSGSLSVRQNLKKRWIANGGAYVVKKSFLEKNKKIRDEKNTLVCEMSKMKSLDIDEEDDFIICELLANSGLMNPE